MKTAIFISDPEMTPAARTALDLADRLRAAGHEVLVLVRQSALCVNPPAAVVEAEAAGLVCRVVRQRMRFDPGLLGQVEMLLGRFDPDAFVSHDLIGMALIRMARWRPRTWGVLYTRPYEGAGLGGRLLRLLERRTLPRADLLLAPGATEAGDLCGWKCPVERIVTGGDEPGLSAFAARLASGVGPPAR